MIKSKKGVLFSLLAVLLVVLGACSNNEETQPTNKETENVNQENTEENMEGIAGAPLEIDSAERTTVYVADFTTKDGEKVTNHKWVTESELSAVE